VRRAPAVALLLVLGVASPLHAVDPGEMLADPALEARARAISAEVRCVVCQNQSIDDSNAEIAHDMRRAIRERLTQGDSDTQVVAFLRARYGDFVLLNPPFDIRTGLMWLGAPLVLLLAAFGLWRGLRRAAARPAGGAAELSSDERARLDALLTEDREARR
jgi:cytochrome c-type biogenesis protein CcmH